MNLASVIAARQTCKNRPAWTGIFAKAYALVAAEVSQLRRAYCQFPWPHFYEYPVSVASILIERDYQDEKAVFVLKVNDPAGRTLPEMDDKVRHAATVPIEKVRTFRNQLWPTRFPLPIRRLMWWTALNIGRFRGRFFGTFAVSVYSSLGAESLHPLSPLTCTLNYGVFGPNGEVDVRLIYDHRVLDGAIVARTLARLEQILNTTIRDELLALGTGQQPGAETGEQRLTSAA